MLASFDFRLWFCLFNAAIFAARVDRELHINHDQVKFIEDYRATRPVSIVNHFQPGLFPDVGCVPFPAVNAEGQVGGGLNPSGDVNGKCSHSRGQVYSRTGQYKDKYAIMYSWYFPKDQFLELVAIVGQRHKWMSIVLWFDEPVTIDSITSAISYYAVDREYSKKPMKINGVTKWRKVFDAILPKERYDFQHPLTDWSTMPQAAREALDFHDFGPGVTQQPPFNTKNFQFQLAEAYRAQADIAN